MSKFCYPQVPQVQLQQMQFPFPGMPGMNMLAPYLMAEQRQQVVYCVVPAVMPVQQQQPGFKGRKAKSLNTAPTTTKSPKSSDAQQQQQQQGKASKPCCEHNSWDNVRVGKSNKLMTLRCRECQSQWRAPVDSVWDSLRCDLFNTEGSCPLGNACTKIHLHSRKEGLKQRVDRFGTSMFKTNKATRPEVAQVLEQYEKKFGPASPAETVEEEEEEEEEEENSSQGEQYERTPQTVEEIVKLVETILHE
eukprot:TRINITY_DN67_c3_g1_i1.p1 TRINITY_DN67_c3_g1~~TRINITY_DN67_c3_g1_i1.p1  ORF type:complete len:270 (+),score=73.93 TRINITY_DN67_c3_g1_i1:69-812(+)